jgi:hypothetical protein
MRGSPQLDWETCGRASRVSSATEWGPSNCMAGAAHVAHNTHSNPQAHLPYCIPFTRQLLRAQIVAVLS